jgi:MFS family permease
LQRVLWLNYTEAGLSAVLFNLGMAGSIFVIGFALELGARDVQIGLLAALPAIASLIQVLGSSLMERFRTAKGLCIASYFAYIVMWGITITAPLLVMRGAIQNTRLAALLAGILLINLIQALLNVSWMAWKAGIIPEGSRGRFFGTRSMIAGLCGMIATLSAGRLVDTWPDRFPGGDPAAVYAWIFGTGIVLATLALVFLRRVPDAPPVEAPPAPFTVRLLGPIRDHNFRLLIVFGMAWGFATGIASPFFNVFMLQHLRMNFSAIAALGLASGFANMGGMMGWGRLSDITGPRPLLAVCIGGVGLMTAGWAWVTPGMTWMLWPLSLLSGLFWSGIALCSISLLMGLAKPGQGGSYFAVFAAASGLCTAAAPVLGGYLLGIFQTWQSPLPLGPIQTLFLLAAVIRLSCLPLLLMVKAPAKVPLSELLQFVREIRRLQPGRLPNWGAGISAMESIDSVLATGSAVIERAVERTISRTARAGQAVGHALFVVDRHLDEQAGAWEAFISRTVDTFAPWVQSRIRWLADEDYPDPKGGANSTSGQENSQRKPTQGGDK